MLDIKHTGEKFSLTGILSSVKEDVPKEFYYINIAGDIRIILFDRYAFRWKDTDKTISLTQRIIEGTFYENIPTVEKYDKISFEDACGDLVSGGVPYYKNVSTGRICRVEINADTTISECSRIMTECNRHNGFYRKDIMWKAKVY